MIKENCVCVAGKKRCSLYSENECTGSSCPEEKRKKNEEAENNKKKIENLDLINKETLKAAATAAATAEKIRRKKLQKKRSKDERER